MSIRRSRLAASDKKRLRRKRHARSERPSDRPRQLEKLEQRQLLAVGPELIGITLEGGQPLVDGTTLNVAPRTLIFEFEDDASINPATLPGRVEVTRSVNDVFGDGDDEVVELGFLGLGNTDTTVLARFASTLPDDKYRIDITGTGSDPLANVVGEPFNEGQDFQTSFELDLAPQVVAVVPQPVSRDAATGNLVRNGNQIVVHFNNDSLSPVSAPINSFYRLINHDDGSLRLPDSVRYERFENRAVLTFAEELPEGNFELQIGDSDETNERLTTATNIGALGADFQLNAFLGDKVSGADDIDLYRFDVLAAGSVEAVVSPSAAVDAHLRLFDAAGVELAADNSGGSGEADTITFAAPDAGTYYLGVSSQPNSGYDPLDGSGAIDGGSSGVYSLNVSFDTALAVDDDNSTFVTATNVGVIGDAGRELSADISATTIPFALPGSIDEPGHRDIPAESHLNRGPLLDGTLPIVRYNFQDIYGTDPSGNALVNAITENQKQRAREVFEIYGDYMGIMFVESDNLGLTIATGDLRAVDPSAPTGPGGVIGISNGSPIGLAVMDAAENWGDSEYGGQWFQTAMHEIGHNLGLGHTYDLPALTIMGDSHSVAPARFPDDGERVFPGDHDLVHAQHLLPPRANDVDLYRFEVAEPGRLSVETIAQRMQPSASLLDTQLMLYREGSAARQILASNDDYFGTDSYLELDLQPGTYYLGVASTGLEDFDPAIANTGFGGTTYGSYDLNFTFDARPRSQLLDLTGTAFDGDADGLPGGQYQFWFQSGGTIYVDKANDSTEGSDGTGTLDDPFDNIPAALELAKSRIMIPVAGGGAFEDGQTFTIFDGVNPQVTFEFDSELGVAPGNEPVPFRATDSAETIAASLAAAIDAAAILNTSAVVDGRQVDLQEADQLDLDGVPALAATPNIVRVVGNGGLDNNLQTPADNVPYLVGLDEFDAPLEDGQELLVPQGVTLVVDAGALLKLQGANIDVGTSSQGISRSHSAVQILGTPDNPVYLRHFRDDSFGGDSDGPSQGPESGGWGGIVFRADSDLEERGVFLNYVGHADLSHGGGQVFVDGDDESFAPLHMIDSRPTIVHNRVSNSAEAAMSAGPKSFDDSLGRIGPDIYGNTIVDNSINGLFIRIRTNLGQPLDRFAGNARWDDFDIVHVLTENLLIAANPGGPRFDSVAGVDVARPTGRLRIDPGVVVKTEGARIEAELGAQLIAEGTASRPIIFTSQKDDSYGGSGSFDTSGDGDATPSMPGQWGGLFFSNRSRGSLDHTVIAYGGGLTPIEGGFDGFDVIEIHQADVRLSRSVIRDNSALSGDTDRSGRGNSERATIFIRGAQPIIVDNTFLNNSGDVISADPNSLQFQINADHGRTTGRAERFSQYDDNHGPLVRGNRLVGNDLNGMNIRGGFLTTRSVWDDVDIVHVVENEIVVPNHHTYSGLQIQSGRNASLVVKLEGANAGFTASGTPLDIQDRIGGTIQILGSGSHPVVFTALEDDSFTAGLDLDGRPQGDTTNNGDSVAVPGDWRSIRLDQFSNDRNVRLFRETEDPFAGQQDVNSTPATSRVLGVLAPDEKSGDDNRALGFQVNGYISLDSPSDVDVYSFRGTAGTEVWIDIDQTNAALDAMVELIDANGRVIARSTANDRLSGAAQDMAKDDWRGGDFYTVNPRDPGMRVTLPGSAGTENSYFVRVRSEPAAGDLENVRGGQSRGEYQLQIRLRQIDEVPGSTVRFSSIHYASNGIEVLGLPSHSPLTSTAAEVTSGNTDLGNLLSSDRGVISVAGNLSAADDVDYYRFILDYDLIQSISGFNDGANTLATVFDIDYADGLSRPNTTIAVFDESTGELILVSRDSNVDADQPPPGQGLGANDLSRGSFGKFDPFLGSVHLPAGVPGTMRSYIVAVMSDEQLPTALNAQFDIMGNSQVRLEPISSVIRIAEDHIGFQGYESGSRDLGATTRVLPRFELFDIDSAIALSANVPELTLKDMILYVSQGDQLLTVNPFTGDITADIGPLAQGAMVPGQSVTDIATRSDGQIFAIEDLPMPMNGTAGAISTVNPETAAQGNRMNDAIPDFMAGPPPMGVDSNGGDALAYLRTGFDLATNTPEYELYYSIRPLGGVSSILYQADPANGSAAIVQMEPWGPKGEISNVGITTGLAFLNGTLYGVSDTGMFYRILRQTGVPFHPQTNAPFQGIEIDGAGSFSGLTTTPDGILLASTNDGRLFALNAQGETLPVFEGGATSVSMGLFGVTGVALSVSDFNLWHPTMRRRDDPGHGINSVFDSSRPDPADATVNVGGYNSNEAEGGASFYFGFEPWTQIDAQNEYFRYGTNGQYGLSQQRHRDLSTNPAILGTNGGNNYNLPGGASGSLLTNPFDLGSYTATDKPALYFNYFLETEDANFDGTGTEGMRDSARVYISPDGGTTWSLLATNNSVPDAELPEFQSASSTASDHSQQRVQELFDNTGEWRQARVDLSDFAGQDGLQLRFAFSTAGSFDEGLDGEQTGSFFDVDRHLLNDFEGWYVDDIIIGLTERGEMVTEAPAALTDTFATPASMTTGGPSQVLAGDYQLEIRRGTQTATTITSDSDEVVITGIFDSNIQLIRSSGLQGDENITVEQGQLQLESNRIENVGGFGIVFDAGARDATGNRPSPGPVKNLPVQNNPRLVPGVTIENNLIVNAASGGIRYRGDANQGNVSTAAVSFGRILNNTIYDGAIGIEVARNASPTVLNNIIANTSTGISIDASSQSTVVGANLFSGNADDGVLGKNAIVQTEGDPLFIDPDRGNFYLAPGSQAIDSSQNSLVDRPSNVAVGAAVGIPPSPIVAPERDFFGQLRVDDPSQEPPPGLGSNIFKDRGAVERADFVGPSGVVIAPLDQGASDLDPSASVVRVAQPILSEILVLVSDVGLGIDDLSVTSEKVLLEKDGVALVDGVDYEFGFDTTNSTIRLTGLPNNGIFRERYDITLDNTIEFGIRDLADNVIRPNRPGGVTAFTVFTAGLNVPPTAADDSNFTIQNLPVDLAVLANDFAIDSPLDPATVTITSPPTNGSVEVLADGVIRYAPEADFAGFDSFNYTVMDLDGDVSNEATATIEVVIDENDAPVLISAPQLSLSSINEDDTDSQGNTVSEILTSVPGDPITDVDIGAVEGLAVIGADDTNGSWQYNLGAEWVDFGTVSETSATLLDTTARVRFVPAEDYNGSSGELVFRAWDQSAGANGDTGVDTSNAGGSSPFSVETNSASLQISPVDDPPRPRDDDDTDPGGLSTTEDQAFTIDESLLLANDLNDSGTDFKIVSIDQSQTLGLVQLRVSSTRTSITYLPNGSFESLTPGQTVTDTFQYTVQESTGLQGTATVTVTISGVNDAPTGVPDSYQTTEDAVLTVPAAGLLENDSDPEDDALQAVAEADLLSELGATVTINEDGSFTYNPATSETLQGLTLGESRQDTFEYRVTDGSAESTTTVTVQVDGRNDAPTAVDDQYTTAEDTTLEVSAEEGVLANDSDGEGSPISAALESDASNGTVSMASDGSFIYTPTTNFFGQDTFTYRVFDGTSSSVGTVTIDVTNANDPPNPADDEYEVAQDSSLVVAAGDGVLSNDSDPDGDTLTAERLSGPQAGSVTLNSDGSFTYVPNSGFFGRDSFVYRAVDALGASGTATVTIDVTNTRLWRNPSNPLDVNGDGSISPADVLLIINYLNSEGPGPVPIPTPPGPPFRDVNGDNNVTSADALAVINELNSETDTGGEGEAAPFWVAGGATSESSTLADSEQREIELIDIALVDEFARPVSDRSGEAASASEESLLEELATELSSAEEHDLLFGRLA